MVLPIQVFVAGGMITPLPERVISNECIPRSSINGKHGGGIVFVRDGRERISEDGERASGRGGEPKPWRMLNPPDRTQSASLLSHSPGCPDFHGLFNPSNNVGDRRRGHYEENPQLTLKEQQIKSNESLTDQELNQQYRKEVTTGRAMASPLLPETAKGIRANIMQSKPLPCKRIMNLEERNAHNGANSASSAGSSALPIDSSEHALGRIQDENHGTQWIMRYKELVVYVREHRNANVPGEFEQNRGLGTWVGRQRKMFKQNKLAEEQISLLHKLDFKFSLREQPGWEVRHAELVEYARENGSANVPERYVQNRPLGRWVHTQRKMFKQNKLTEDQISRLRKLDFKFSVRKQRVGWSVWDVKYAELVKHVREHGNANDSQEYEQNFSLGTWVSTQRKMFKQNKLCEEEINHLRKLDFKFL